MRRDRRGLSHIGKIIAHWREPEFRSASQQTCNRLIKFAIDTYAGKMMRVAANVRQKVETASRCLEAA
jgi:hypothetical protein